ncbi:MAG TPA: hypothetical protein VJU61_05795, partial [Polyangiaceae bacterium]|nr:hypothetical protein [Polyangiaceae bacterium]
IGSGTDWTAVDTMGHTTCGLRGAGTLHCWGYNDNATVGNGTYVVQTAPVQIGASLWTQVSGFDDHACGIRSGALYCWGSNGVGQHGDGTTNDHPTPTRIGALSDWTEISAGGSHTCGRRAGALYCWGDALGGKLGNGTSTSTPTLTPLRIGTASDWSELSVGWNHSCGYRSDGPYCWGMNQEGQLGDNSITNRLSPILITLPAP